MLPCLTVKPAGIAGIQHLQTLPAHSLSHPKRKLLDKAAFSDWLLLCAHPAVSFRGVVPMPPEIFEKLKDRPDLPELAELWRTTPFDADG
jgi:hypothetical protein